MSIVNEFRPGSQTPGSVVTVGTFDGVHLGHLKILMALLEEAENSQLIPVVVTFYPHPQQIVMTKNGNPIRLLTDKVYKVNLLKEIGIPQVEVLEFDKEMAHLSYEEFIDIYLINKLNMKKMIVGHDHALGKNRQGKWPELSALGKARGFSLTRVDPFYLNGIRVSSSSIRHFLNEGRIKTASEYLGRNYSLSGTVVNGEKRGRVLDFPTANLQIENKSLLVPLAGVYAVYVSLKSRQYNGMLNIGNRPTFDGKNTTIEVHLLEFNQMIYGENLKIEFVKWLRPETKFRNVEALISQLKKDKEKCNKILN